MTSPADAKQGQTWQDAWRPAAEQALTEWIASLAETICPADGVSSAGWWYAGWRAREPEIERLRQREAALREALQAMLSSTQPDSIMADVFAARRTARAALAQTKQP